MFEEYQNKKLDIVIVCGQSNAEGNGCGTSNIKYDVSGVYQFVEENPATIVIPKEGIAYAKVNFPITCKVENLAERKVGDTSMSEFSITFASDYKKNCLKADRDLIIVKAALGGSGFALNQWGVGTDLYTRLVTMTKMLKDLNTENRIVAVLWHQGEHDAFENASFSDEERFNFYVSKYTEQFNDFRTKFNDDKFPIINGEFVDHWSLLPENKRQCEVVESALRECNKLLGFSGMVSSVGLFSNDQDNHNGDNIHFCRDSLYKLGSRYFDEYIKITK